MHISPVILTLEVYIVGTPEGFSVTAKFWLLFLEGWNNSDVVDGLERPVDIWELEEKITTNLLRENVMRGSKPWGMELCSSLVLLCLIPLPYTSIYTPTYLPTNVFSLNHATQGTSNYVIRYFFARSSTRVSHMVCTKRYSVYWPKGLFGIVALIIVKDISLCVSHPTSRVIGWKFVSGYKYLYIKLRRSIQSFVSFFYTIHYRRCILNF